MRIVKLTLSETPKPINDQCLWKLLSPQLISMDILRMKIREEAFRRSRGASPNTVFTRRSLTAAWSARGNSGEVESGRQPYTG